MRNETRNDVDGVDDDDGDGVDDDGKDGHDVGGDDGFSSLFHSFACLLLFLFLLGREEGEVGEEEEGVESNPIPRIPWIGAGRLVARPARRRGGPSADPSNPRGPPRV